MAGRFKVEAVFTAVDRVSSPVTRMENRVNRLTRNMQRGFYRLNKSVNQFSAGMKKAAIAATGSLLVFGSAMAGVINTGADFEQTLVNAAAKFPKQILPTTKAFEKLENSAKKVGATTEFTASEAAGAINFLAMAGFNAESAVAALPGVVDLATAAQIDLATATDIASDSLGAFGLATKDVKQLGVNLSRVNDVLATTATSSNTTISDIFEAVKDAAPIATTAGASIETFSALAGTLASSSIKGSRAGTALKNLFTSISAPTSEGAKIFKKLNIETLDVHGNVKDVIDIIGELNVALAKEGSGARLAATKGIFGKNSLSGATVLLAAGQENLRTYTKMLQGSKDAAAKMADIMRNTFRGRINSLKSAIEGISINIFSGSNTELSKAVESMTEFVRENGDLIASNVSGFLTTIIKNFGQIYKWIKRIGIALIVFYSFIAVLKTLIIVMTAVNLVMALNPVFLIVVAIFALIAAVTALIVWWDKLKAAFLSLSKTKKSLIMIMSPITAIIGGIMMLQEVWGGIAKFFTNTWKKIVSTFKQSSLLILISPLAGLINSASKVKQAWASIKGFFTGLWSAIINIFDAAIKNIKRVVNQVSKAIMFVSHTIATIFDTLTAFISASAKAFSQFINPISLFVNVVSALKHVLHQALSFLVSTWENTAAAIKRTLENYILSPVKDLIKIALSVKLAWEPLKDFFVNLWSGITMQKAAKSNLLNPLMALANAAAYIKSAWEPIKDFFNSLWSGITGIFDASIQRMTSIVEKMKNAMSFVSEPVSDSFSRLTNFIGLNADDGEQKDSPSVISPQDRVIKKMEESKTVSSAEVVIKDETNRAEVSKGKLNAGITLQPTGAF